MDLPKGSYDLGWAGTRYVLYGMEPRKVYVILNGPVQDVNNRDGFRIMWGEYVRERSKKRQDGRDPRKARKMERYMCMSNTGWTRKRSYFFSRMLVLSMMAHVIGFVVGIDLGAVVGRSGDVASLLHPRWTQLTTQHFNSCRRAYRLSARERTSARSIGC